MIELTTKLFDRLGIKWVDDNPKQKPHHWGDILVYIGEHEFTNNASAAREEGRFATWCGGCSFGTYQELRLVYAVLNNWTWLPTEEELLAELAKESTAAG